MSNDRLESLESRFAWLERHMAEQDKAMLELVEEQRRVRRHLDALSARLATDEEDETEAGKDERPPHY